MDFFFKEKQLPNINVVCELKPTCYLLKTAIKDVGTMGKFYIGWALDYC